MVQTVAKSEKKVQYRGEVAFVIYQNSVSGYTVFSFVTDSERRKISCTGYFTQNPEKSKLEIEGHWDKHPKYGDQLVVDSYSEILPQTETGIINYLSSGMIKGIGNVLAERIVKCFGSDTLEIIDKTPGRLLEVEGIGKRKYERIIDSWQQNNELRDIMVFLKKNNISNNLALKIYKTYGRGSITQLRADPYKLADDIDGVGFSRADETALKIGIDKDDPVRLRSGIKYVLKVMTERGNVFVLKEDLVMKCRKILGTDNNTGISYLKELMCYNISAT